jgi:hypothetical protein
VTAAERRETKVANGLSTLVRALWCHPPSPRKRVQKRGRISILPLFSLRTHAPVTNRLIAFSALTRYPRPDKSHSRARGRANPESRAPYVSCFWIPDPPLRGVPE